MKIAVFGCGAIGGFFGGRLAQAGEDVTFIARGQTLEALTKDGLSVNSIDGDFNVLAPLATDNPAQVGEVDLVIVAVKTWQVPAAAIAIKPMIGSDTVVLPLQNGVEAAAHLAHVIAERHVLGGLCKIIASVKVPGEIWHMGAEPTVVLGELDGRNRQRLQQVAEVFTQAGVTVHVTNDIQSAIWQKFLFIAAWSGLGAVTRSTVGAIRDNPRTREMLINAMSEIESVGRASGIDLPENIVDNTMTFLDSLPAEGTTSMQRDILAGKPSELESQNGAVMRLGESKGVSTPVNSMIYSVLELLERQARQLESS